MDIKIKVENEKAYVYTPFNKNFAKKMRAMNGTWNGSAWVVNTMFVSAVREIMRNVYGYDDTDTDIQTVTLRIVFLVHIMMESGCLGRPSQLHTAGIPAQN